MVIDILLGALIIGGVVLGARRGFGKVVFDFVALLIAIRIVPLIVPKLSKSIQLMGDAQANEAVWFAGLFVVVGMLLLFVGKIAYDSTLISLGTFDLALGGVLGLGLVVIIGHAITKSLVIAASISGAPPEILLESKLGMEFYQFVIYHEVIEFMSSLAK